MYKWAACLMCMLPITSVGFVLPEQTEVRNVEVSGRVLDEHGVPVAGAQISILPLEVGLSGGMPAAKTDEAGRYTLVVPPYGKARFCAIKESQGYPDTQLLLFVSGAETMPEVELISGAQLEVDIHLGAPDGILSATVVDAKTGNAVRNATLLLRRSDWITAFHRTTLPANGQFSFALPPAPIQISVMAPGYKTWVYKDQQTDMSGLVLARSSHKVLTIAMEPL